MTAKPSVAQSEQWQDPGTPPPAANDRSLKLNRRFYMTLKKILSHGALALVLLSPLSSWELRAENKPTETETQFRYVVRTGDTSSRLAKRWGIAESVFCKPGEKLKVGQTVTIPLAARVRVPTGSSLSALSHKYHHSVETLARFNQIPPPYTLRAGQTILIPQTVAPEHPPMLKTQH
jgi:LysM repeat protein